MRFAARPAGCWSNQENFKLIAPLLKHFIQPFFFKQYPAEFQI